VSDVCESEYLTKLCIGNSWHYQPYHSLCSWRDCVH